MTKLECVGHVDFNIFFFILDHGWGKFRANWCGHISQSATSF